MSFFKLPFIINFIKKKDIEGYENLQRRIFGKKEFLDNILNILKIFENSFKDISEKVQKENVNIIKMKYEPEEKNIHDIIKLVCLNIQKDLEINSILLNQIKKHFSTHKDILIKELNYYKELKKVNKYVQEEKEKLNLNKELFNKLGREVEKDIKNFIKEFPNLNDIYENEIKNNDLLKIIESPKDVFEDYKRSLNKTNQLIKIYNSKQLSLFKFFQEIINEEGLFYPKLINIYLQNLEKLKESINFDIKTIQNDKILEKNTKLIELIEETIKNKQEEKIQILTQYQTELLFNKCENDKEFELFIKSIKIIKNTISYDLFPQYDYELEYKNYKMSQIIKKFFKEKENINPEVVENFKNLIKDPSIYKGFFMILSNLRSNNKCFQSKFLIDLLGKEFNIIAENSIKTKLYDIFQNVVIISQTYYYEDENKNKIYIFNHFKNNKYIKNTKFWRDFIENRIKEDFNRLESLHEFYINIEKNINITKKVKDKLNEIVFSQLVTYANNMKEFEIDKRIILKIIEEFMEKYNYLSENYIKTLFEIIIEGEDIEKIRKEYNPSLEDELNEEKANITEKQKEDINNNHDEKNKEKEYEIKDNNEKGNNIKGNIKKGNNTDNVKKNENNENGKKENVFDNESQNENINNENESNENTLHNKNINKNKNENINNNNDKKE